MTGDDELDDDEIKAIPDDSDAIAEDHQENVRRGAGDRDEDDE